MINLEIRAIRKNKWIERIKIYKNHEIYFRIYYTYNFNKISGEWRGYYAFS